MRFSLILSLGIATSGAAQGLGGGLPSPLIENVTNAPNPFDSRRGGLDGQTQIRYQLSTASAVHVTLYDLFGAKVRHWDFFADSEGGRAGSNQFLWDGTNAAGQKVSKGGYLASIEVESTDGASARIIRKIGVIH